MNYKTACDNLGLNNDVNEITLELLKKQYKLKALQYHPDKNKSENASEKFQEINNSYQFLLKQFEFSQPYNSEDDVDDDDFDDDIGSRNGYKWVLYSFLKNIIINRDKKGIFYTIIQKLSSSCEKKALETLEKLDKQLLIQVFEILSNYKEAFHFSSEFYEIMEGIIKRKIKGDECIILNPTIDDLLDNNLYKLKVNDFVYIIPLWHQELIYDNSGSDVYVKCYPELDEHIRIDNKNNIHINIEYKIQDIWDKTRVEFTIGKAAFSFLKSELKLLENQVIILYNNGISKINTKDIFDVSIKSNMYLYIRLHI
jgi:hypothetical protein